MKFILFTILKISGAFFHPSRHTYIKQTSLYSTHPNIRCIATTCHSSINETKRFIIDIDGTICNTIDSNYLKSTPKISNIAIFNKLYDKGYQIHYWTARGANSGKDWDDFTIMQLKLWNVKYTTINMGKPHYDVWIDDKAINANDVSSILLGLDFFSK